VAVVFVVLGVGLAVSSSLTSREKRITQLKHDVGELDALRARYEEAVAAEKRNSQRIKTNSTSLFSLIQKSASELGFALSDLNERRLPVKDNAELSEISVDVNIKEISVDKLTSLLEKLEGKRSDGVVKVSKLRVKTKFGDQADMLEVAMTVTTWRGNMAGTPEPAGATP
jgi:chromosome segregation ATPase